jgi:hypothetical protein
MGIFREAIRRDVIAAADVVDYLDVSADALTSSSTQPGHHEDA